MLDSKSCNQNYFAYVRSRTDSNGVSKYGVERSSENNPVGCFNIKAGPVDNPPSVLIHFELTRGQGEIV
jgi:hypothetical protein